MHKCAACSAFAHEEKLPEVPASAERCRLLSSYLLNLDKGAAAVGEMIVEDIRGHRDLGAHRYASDLLVVLKCFLSKFPEAGPIENLRQYEGGEFAA